METSDEDLGFEWDEFNLEAEPEAASAEMETSDEDLGFEWDEFNLEAEPEAASAEMETSDEDLDFEWDEFNLEAEPETDPDASELTLTLEFEDEEVPESSDDETEGLDLESFDLAHFSEDQEPLESIEELSLDDLLGENYDDVGNRDERSSFAAEIQLQPQADHEEDLNFDDMFADEFPEEETSDSQATAETPEPAPP